MYVSRDYLSCEFRLPLCTGVWRGSLRIKVPHCRRITRVNIVSSQYYFLFDLITFPYYLTQPTTRHAIAEPTIKSLRYSVVHTLLIEPEQRTIDGGKERETPASL